MKKTHTSIRTKILGCFAFLMLLVLISQLVFNLFLARPYFIWQKKNTIESSFYEVKKNYTDDLNDVSSIAMDLQNVHSIQTVLMIDNEVVYSTSPFNKMDKMSDKPFLPDEPNLSENYNFSETPKTIVTEQREEGMSTLQLTGRFDYNGDDVDVIMTLSVSSIDNSISMFTQISIMISVAALILGVIIAFLFSKSITSPITSVERVAKNLSNLDFSEFADETASTRELSNLAVSINTMSTKLKNSIEELQIANEALKKDIDYQKQIEQLRREFIANVSHEMKTPLGLLQIYSENLKCNIDGIDKDYYCDVIIEETNNLNEMVKSMLDISSIESGLSKMNFENFDFSELCEQTFSKYVPVFQDYDVSVNIDSGVNINGDRKYLEQAIKNYVANAVNHTDNGKKIEITLSKGVDDATLYVKNQGKNIAESDIDNIWVAFYKSDKARTRTENNNVGLGLYIEKTVIDKHFGKYGVKNVEDGVEFYFSLPLNKNQSKMLTDESNLPS
ncbi:MAG: HAMP domain-containing histidine kinase [Clostridiales bacterium]|nr:HAMP domain-containing histidine kinase [Clostridiales bacterium]